MTCYHPVPVWKAKQANASGKHSVVFAEHLGIDGTRMEIPCGGCIGCRLDKAAEWQTRMLHESKEHRMNCFITLTYADEHLPPRESLQHRDFQLFMKRLRNTGVKPRYYMCGEYGETTGRPHYHAILFGHDFADKKNPKKTKQGHSLYESPQLTELWGKGKTWIGACTPDSCGYVARYITKKVRGEAAPLYYTRVNKETGELEPIEHEYARMSLKPGIGATFYEKYKGEIHNQDSVIVKQQKRKVPRYYDKQLEKFDPFSLEELKFLRSEKAQTRAADSTPDRLLVREEFKKERTKSLLRNFL